MNAFPFLARLVGPSIYVAVKKKNITFPFNRRLYYCVTLDASLPMKKLVKLLNFFFLSSCLSSFCVLILFLLSLKQGAHGLDHIFLIAYLKS